MDPIGDICRICLSIGANAALFNESNGSPQLYEKLIFCTGLAVYSTDDLPKMICGACSDQLENSHKFKQKATETDSYLRSKFSAIKEELALVRNDCHNDLFSDLSYSNNESLTLLPTLSFTEGITKPESLRSIDKNEYKLDDIKMRLKTKLSFKKLTPLEFPNSLYNYGLGELHSDNFEDFEKFAANLPCGDGGRSTLDCAEEFNAGKKSKRKSIRNNYTCDDCECQFINVKKLIHHLKLEHNKKLYQKSRKHMCDLCGKIFCDNHGLQRHKLCHSGTKPYSCRICGALFSQQGNMERHLLAKHAKVKQFQCDQCPMKFSYKSTLKDHLQCHHAGEKKYACGTCGKRFSKSFSLKRHTLTHTNQRPYMCQFCDKAYAQSYDLKLHEKRIHPQFS